MSIACVWNARNVRETDVLDGLLGASMMPHQTAASWRCGPTTTKTDLEARVLQPWHPMWSLCCKPSLRPDSNIKEQSKDVAFITNNESTQAKHVKLKHDAAQKLSFCEAALLPIVHGNFAEWTLKIRWSFKQPRFFWHIHDQIQNANVIQVTIRGQHDNIAE